MSRSRFCFQAFRVHNLSKDAAYLIGLIFTLKTHLHIYEFHISDAHCHGAYLWFCIWIMPFWLCDVLFNVLIILFVLVISDHSAVVHCIAVQVCMLQIPLLVLSNAFYVSHTPEKFLLLSSTVWHRFFLFLPRMLDSFSYSVIYTSGQASLVLFWSTTYLWMESQTTSRVSVVISITD